MKHFARFYLDKEKDIVVDLSMTKEQLSYVLRTPNHGTGNLITNLAVMFSLPLSYAKDGMKIVAGTIPCYLDAANRPVYIFHLGKTKVANIYPDGTIERKAYIPAISKTLMSQTKDYRLPYEKTIVKTFIRKEEKFRADLHTHMNANLEPDTLIALGICHQIEYSLYYIKKLGLRLNAAQSRKLNKQRRLAAGRMTDLSQSDPHRDRHIDDAVRINFADLILNNIANAAYNIARIRTSLAVIKDGQAVFTNLEKVYLYRYVFTKGKPAGRRIKLHNIDQIPDSDIARTVKAVLDDHLGQTYAGNTIYQDILLWTARMYRDHGIVYAEISDTSLVAKERAFETLRQIHEVMPAVYAETKVRLRFLAALRRIPLTIVKDQITGADYQQNLQVLQAVMIDPYIAGCDIVGEEINDIKDLQPVISRLTALAGTDPGFVIRIHAGENDSIKDNVASSIDAVAAGLQPGQKMPHLRIGHGLYTANLATAKGQRLLASLLKYHVILEFQITSNVRLNNLNSLKRHPLKQYLAAGIPCVQGTDGGGLYGTDSIDEQLALQKMLDLSDAEIIQMKKAADRVIAVSRRDFERKEKKMAGLLADTSLTRLLAGRLAKAEEQDTAVVFPLTRFAAGPTFKKQIRPLPPTGLPVIIAGGSYNSDRHFTVLRQSDRLIIDAILQQADPRKIFFVIGYRLAGAEKYLLEQNKGRFEIYSFVPSMVSADQIKKICNTDLAVRVALESSGMGLYKSLNYEIFRQRPSVLVAFDGDGAGMNLIQEANLHRQTRIFISSHAASLKKKAAMIEGYVTIFDSAAIVDEMMKWLSGEKSFRHHSDRMML